MKRWIVPLLVIAALVVLISPGIVGYLAERNLKENIGWAEADAPDVRVRTESFDRGWFTSEGRHRVSLTGTPFMGHRDQAASIIIETHVDHGILPITSLGRDGGSLEPGIARAVSTFHLDTGEGGTIELPGKAYSTIGLTGVTEVRYLLEKGNHEQDENRAAWDGADITVSIDPDQRTLGVDGMLEKVTFSSNSQTGSIDGIEIRGMERQTEYGFSIGNIDLTTGAIRFTDANGTSGGFDELRLQGETQLDAKLVNADYTMNVGGLSAPMLGELGLDIAVTVDGLDAPAVGKLSAAIRNAESAANPMRPTTGIYPLIEKDLQSLVAAGGSVDVRQFDVSLPQGPITSKLKFSIDRSSPDDAFSWPALALLLTASADVRMPAMLVDMMLMVNPEADAIRATGLLRRDGDAYEVQAEFAQGLLTVNGAPFPIPVQGF